ncbi:MAG: CoA transferase [Deltaproteobacteria bacterium]|nr:CoA transferase [Deltaproteobacteria bacterium]
MSNEGALAGITVLDLSRLLPGPCCSMMLADHGARVIAIEDKRFIADDLFITTVNRNKEHMSLNLKTLEGKEIFFRLVERADVLLEGFRPGVVHRLGIDYDTVCKINSKIIYCSITGYGQTGPCRDRAGHDVNFLAHSGVLDLIGEPDRPPSIPGVQIADIAGGGMNAAIGILLALVGPFFYSSAPARTPSAETCSFHIDMPVTTPTRQLTDATSQSVPWKIVSGRTCVSIWRCRNTHHCSTMKSAGLKSLIACVQPSNKRP